MEPWDELDPPEDGLTDEELAGCPHPADQEWQRFNEELDEQAEKAYVESL